MKLSYTMHNWPGRDWADFCAAAAETRLQGVEMDSVQNPVFCARTSPTNPELALSAKRSLTRQDLSVPCIGTDVDFAAPQAEHVIRDTISVARNLSVPYVVLSTACEDTDAAAAALAPYVAAAERSGVVLLLETAGALADTGRARDVLNRFACDSLAACWNMFATCFAAGESAETTITNLGAGSSLGCA